MGKIKLLVFIGFFIASNPSIAQTISDSSAEMHYGNALSYILKTQSYIISREGKPDSIHTIAHQGIIMSYKKKQSDRDKSNNREYAFFFDYEPLTTKLVDTCVDMEIDDPKEEAKGWIEYLDKKYKKDIIVKGEDQEGSVGCEREWYYSQNSRICLSMRNNQVQIQLNCIKRY